MYKLLFFVLFSTVLNAADVISINEQCNKRTQQYPIAGYQKVVLFSPYRTGSTLVYNVLRFLFEDPYFLDKPIWGNNDSIVGKTHTLGYIDPTTIIFCTIRNPVDTCFSRCRIIMSQEKSKEIDERVIEVVVQEYLVQMQWVKSLMQRELPNVVLLKYEDFNANLSVIFDRVESVFNIQISEIDRLLMDEVFAKDNIALITKELKDFSHYDQSTLLHGAHIEGDEFTVEEKALIHDEIKKKLSGKCGFLEEYGYMLD